MNASNLTVNSAMRFRRSSKLKSTDGSCVSGLSEYDMAGAVCDRDARKDEVLVENDDGGIVVAMFVVCSVVGVGCGGEACDLSAVKNVK